MVEALSSNFDPGRARLGLVTVQFHGELERRVRTLERTLVKQPNLRTDMRTLMQKEVEELSILAGVANEVANRYLKWPFTPEHQPFSDRNF